MGTHKKKRKDIGLIYAINDYILHIQVTLVHATRIYIYLLTQKINIFPTCFQLKIETII